MKRFILVSFAFIALAFYEVSGGADFDPIVAREAAMTSRADPNSETPFQSEKSNTFQTVMSEPIEDAPTVTRLSLNLTSFEDALDDKEATRPAPILSKPAPQPESIEPPNAPDIVTAASVTFDTTPDENGVLPSIIFSGSRSQASSQSVSQPRDIRFVSASIVNMRGGPGTGFDVVTKLQRDTEVEILQDDGSGWVKLRAVSGGPEGWIADYLLSNG